MYVKSSSTMHFFAATLASSSHSCLSVIVSTCEPGQVFVKQCLLFMPGLPLRHANFAIDSIESRPSYGYEPFNDVWVRGLVSTE